jgi:hypothetical protein
MLDLRCCSPGRVKLRMTLAAPLDPPPSVSLGAARSQAPTPGSAVPWEQGKTPHALREVAPGGMGRWVIPSMKRYGRVPSLPAPAANDRGVTTGAIGPIISTI